MVLDEQSRAEKELCGKTGTIAADNLLRNDSDDIHCVLVAEQHGPVEKVRVMHGVQRSGTACRAYLQIRQAVHLLLRQPARVSTIRLGAWDVRGRLRWIFLNAISRKGTSI